MRGSGFFRRAVEEKTGTSMKGAMEDSAQTTGMPTPQLLSSASRRPASFSARSVSTVSERVASRLSRSNVRATSAARATRWGSGATPMRPAMCSRCPSSVP